MNTVYKWDQFVLWQWWLHPETQSDSHAVGQGQRLWEQAFPGQLAFINGTLPMLALFFFASITDTCTTELSEKTDLSSVVARPGSLTRTACPHLTDGTCSFSLFFFSSSLFLTFQASWAFPELAQGLYLSAPDGTVILGSDNYIAVLSESPRSYDLWFPTPRSHDFWCPTARCLCRSGSTWEEMLRWWRQPRMNNGKNMEYCIVLHWYGSLNQTPPTPRLSSNRTSLGLPLFSHPQIQASLLR